MCASRAARPTLSLTTGSPGRGRPRTSIDSARVVLHRCLLSPSIRARCLVSAKRAASAPEVSPMCCASRGSSLTSLPGTRSCGALTVVVKKTRLASNPTDVAAHTQLCGRRALSSIKSFFSQEKLHLQSLVFKGQLTLGLRLVDARPDYTAQKISWLSAKTTSITTAKRLLLGNNALGPPGDPHTLEWSH